MVDWIGRWSGEKGYSAYPKEKWCNMDYVANYIKEKKYNPKTTIENLVSMIILHFEGEIEDEKSSFLPAYNENGMINLESLSSFIEASGGLREFDYCV